MRILNRRTATAILILGLVACQSSPSTATTRRHKGLLLDAGRALKSEREQRAMEFARMVETESTQPESRLGAGILIVGAHLRRGEIDDAEARVRQLRSQYGNDPGLDELDGKLALERFEYREAAQRFADAETGYASWPSDQRPPHLSRAADLRYFAEGLESYATGQLDDAERAWNRIEDLHFRDEINRTLANVSTRSTRGSL